MRRDAEPVLALKVPATTANMGPGFDTFGMALSLHNRFSVTDVLPEGRFTVRVTGEGAQELGDVEKNLLVKSYCRACDEWGVPRRGFALESRNAIPLRRGLGSSSTAVVAGVMLANLLTDARAPEDEALRLMTAIEGHPDNVVPCAVGGMTISCWDGERLCCVRLPPLPQDLQAVAVVPDCEVSTESARAILPGEVPFRDATLNVSRAALLAAAWATGRWDVLPFVSEDRLHQPYRAGLIPGGAEVLEEARRRSECAAAFISGSGPTMIALTRGPTEPVASAMRAAFARHGLSARALILSGTAEGATVHDRRATASQ